MNKFVKYALVAVVGLALFLVCSSRKRSRLVLPTPSAPADLSTPPRPQQKAPSPRQASPQPQFGKADTMLAGDRAAAPAAAPLPSPGAAAALPATAAAPGAAPGAGTAEPAGKAFNAAEAQSVMNNAMPALGACLEGGGSAAASIEFELQPTGKPQGVRIKGGLPAGPERCMLDVMSRLRFPTFDGAPHQMSFPLSVYQRPAAPSAPPQQVYSPTSPSGGQPILIEP